MADLSLPAGAAVIPERARPRAAGHGLVATLLATPAVFLMAMLLIGPVLAVVAMSFTDWSLGDRSFGWVGLGNYREMWESDLFWKSIVNTVIYVGVVVPGSVLLGLGAAMLIESLVVGKGFWRAVYFLPVMATLVAMAIVWETMLNPTIGLVGDFFRLFGAEPPFWLTDKALALPSLCLIGIWQAVGFNMVLFMAGLTSIPRELYHAAELDGARSAWDRFRLVTWPLLGPVTLFVLVITSIRSFQVFDTVHVLTQGGPDNASYVLVYGIYQEGFEFFRSAYASALTVVFLVFILILTALKVFGIERKVHYR